VDSVDLDSLAWRAVELAVQRRHDPRLIIATRPTIGGPASTARLLAGLCNAAAGRRVVALFGVDGTDVIGVDEPPEEHWLDAIAARFPGVVPTLATATIDADGAHIVALTADDAGTLIVATQSGRVVIPWFDGTLADRPPAVGPDRGPLRPVGRLEIRSGWLERTGTCVLGPTEPATASPASTDRADAHARGDADADADGIIVWRGVLDIALALDTLTATAGTDTDTAAPSPAPVTVAADSGILPAGSDTDRIVDGKSGQSTGRPAQRRRCVAIADRDLSVTLLADGSAAALSLDAQIHPTPGAAATTRTDGGLLLDPLVPCRLYLAAAVAAPVFDQPGDLGGPMRLLVSLRFPGDDRLVAAMVTLGRDDATTSQRWTM
jgi:hypothetical protein